MKTLFGALFELLRIMIIFWFLGALGCLLIEGFYQINEQVEAYSWLAGLAIYVLLFVLYRNKLQFSGFYRGQGRRTLPKHVSATLIFVSIVLLVSPFIMGAL